MLLILCVTATNSNAQKIEVVGEWTMSQETPMGKRVTQMTISQDSTDGSFWSGKKEYEIAVEGNELRWKQPFSTPMGSIEANFTGQINDSDRLSGTFSFSEGPLKGRTSNWEATRIITQQGLSSKKESKKRKKRSKDKINYD